ncbi:hypothetical protein Slala03_05850 [Streptomyces lavendulae subsp. lavendulae]|nr:hypothetical protein Slala03_05850 [Streptomyces lavendulae subsp. lavendulae]GLX35501.1 hypothetical protein Sros01_15740 [Streptomyces roseochromogenus]
MISCICGADLVVVAKFRAAEVPRLRCGVWGSVSEPAWTDMSFPFDHSMDLRDGTLPARNVVGPLHKRVGLLRVGLGILHG